MDLPVGIEQEILEYLHLEYGEDANDPSSLKLEDIQYDGLFDVAGTPRTTSNMESGNGQRLSLLVIPMSLA